MVATAKASKKSLKSAAIAAQRSARYDVLLGVKDPSHLFDLAASLRFVDKAWGCLLCQFPQVEDLARFSTWEILRILEGYDAIK